MSFKALFIDKQNDKPQCSLQSLEEHQLPDGDVSIDVEYSSLNYKDALAITNKAPIIRKFPMVPGIDFSGTVTQSSHSDWKTGDQVILNGWGVGEQHWGGLAEKARINGDWLIRLPEALNSQQAMAIGTAGYTAMLSVMAIIDHNIKPDAGEILVTGANGGVGSFSIAILAALGYSVVASTGRPENSEYLTSLGASDTIHRNELSEPGKPLGKERWSAVVDCVGSHTLANACATTRYGGIIAASGLAQGMDLPMTVAPFILRGITLAGIDSVNAAKERRQRAWTKLAELLDSNKLDEMSNTIPLEATIDAANNLLNGQVKGRLVVQPNT